MIYIIVIIIPFLIGALIYSHKVDRFNQRTEHLVKEFNQYIKQEKHR